MPMMIICFNLSAIPAGDILFFNVLFLLSCGVYRFYNALPISWFIEPTVGDKPSANPDMRKFPDGVIFCIINLYIGFIFYLQSGFCFLFFLQLGALWILSMIFVSDLKTRIIPDQLVVALALIALLWAFHDLSRIALTGDMWYQIPLQRLSGALAGGLSMLLIYLTGKWVTGQEALGMGDLKYFFSCGLITGINGILPVLFLSFLIAFPFSLCRFIYTRIKHIEDRSIPFGPFISISLALFLLFPEVVLINRIL
jgi:prepilin signal peptidase PulO-like enzyme (type II secretory pathway)